MKVPFLKWFENSTLSIVGWKSFPMANTTFTSDTTRNSIASWRNFCSRTCSWISIFSDSCCHLFTEMFVCFLLLLDMEYNCIFKCLSKFVWIIFLCFFWCFSALLLLLWRFLQHSTEHVPVVMIQYITNVTKWWIFVVIDVQLCRPVTVFLNLVFLH